MQARRRRTRSGTSGSTAALWPNFHSPATQGRRLLPPAARQLVFLAHSRSLFLWLISSISSFVTFWNVLKPFETRLLGTFQVNTSLAHLLNISSFKTLQGVEHVFIVGVGGGVPHYTDWNRHVSCTSVKSTCSYKFNLQVRLGDVVMAAPNRDGQRFIYQYCQAAEVLLLFLYIYCINVTTPGARNRGGSFWDKILVSTRALTSASRRAIAARGK